MQTETTRTPAEILVRVIDYFQHEAMYAKKQVDEWSEKYLDTNPTYAFEWGDNAVAAAGRWHAASAIMEWLEDAEDSNDARGTLAVALKRARRDVLNLASRLTSSSSMSNLTATAKLQGFAHYCGGLEVLPESIAKVDEWLASQ